MAAPLRIGIVGDFNAGLRSHAATNEAIARAADYLGVAVDVRWLSTPFVLSRDGEGSLAECDGLWAAPGSPYQSMEGALHAIRFARERDRPFVGT
jgi:CTP synthase (UTP-ammonia lyase)